MLVLRERSFRQNGGPGDWACGQSRAPGALEHDRQRNDCHDRRDCSEIDRYVQHYSSIRPSWVQGASARI
jgi:hypothetical protein